MMAAIGWGLFAGIVLAILYDVISVTISRRDPGEAFLVVRITNSEGETRTWRWPK